MRGIAVSRVVTLDLGRSRGGGRGRGRPLLAGVQLAAAARLPALGPYRAEIRIPTELQGLPTPTGVERVGAFWRIDEIR